MKTDLVAPDACRETAASPAECSHRSPHWSRFRNFFQPLAALLLLFAGTTHGATFRWASSSNRIYVESGGSATLSDIKAALPNAPLDLIDSANAVWLLRANLQVEDGSVLLLHGTAAGGDVNEFRLQSDNSSASNSFVSVNADWGGIDIKSTRITSWDSA